MVIDGGTEHVHLHGAAADHAEWSVSWSAEDQGREEFDADALERAMVEARRSAYSELADLDAA